MPAHITLLYPFVPPAEISEAAITRVSTFAAAQSAFAYRLSSTARFSDVLYLVPDPARPFVNLVKTLVQRFPDYLPYRGQFTAIVPHLTVASGEELPLNEIDAELCSDPNFKSGVSAFCATLALVENTSGLWRERARFPLTRGNVR